MRAQKSDTSLANWIVRFGFNGLLGAHCVCPRLGTLFCSDTALSLSRSFLIQLAKLEEAGQFGA